MHGISATAPLLRSTPPDGGPRAISIEPTLALALSDPTRAQIIQELNSRTMSPSQFADERGGDLSHVSRCFRQLEGWGFAEVVERQPGQRRGASVEHVYRGVAGGSLAPPNWKDKPLSAQEAESQSILRSFFSRAADAIETGTMGTESSCHLTWDTIALDAPAWRQLVARLEELQARFAEFGVAAADRLAGSSQESIPATVGLACFRSAQPVDNLLKLPRTDVSGITSRRGAEQLPFILSPQIAKALSNRWRSQIVMEIAALPMSPSQFVERFGGDPSYVARCFRELAGWGFIELVEERKGGRRGGGVERVYRATARTIIDESGFEAMPALLRREVNTTFLSQYLGQAADAIEAGTLDTDPDRHLSWRGMVLDRAAWNEIADELRQLFIWSYELERETVARRTPVPARIPAIVGLWCFRSPAA